MIEIHLWTKFSVLRNEFAKRYVGTIFYETHPKNKLAFLNYLIGVNEYEVDAQGNYETQVMGMETM